ncbi:MAG: DUF1684 domain-containing protein [Gemmatimonadota bacterium]|jgi:uncharacterized protein (DUF1684 family)
MVRRGKDRFFRDGFQSPIPLQERGSFEGLKYYPLDPSYRFELQLHEYPEKEVITVDATHGGTRDLLRWGEFRFEIDGKEHALQAYRTEAGTKRLFVPFGDKTSGTETFANGRYLDLEPEIHRTAGERWILDFNEAYNPWCEYSDEFVCPYAPPENWLDTPIRSGEKSLLP